MAILKSEEIINIVRTILKSLECAICLEPMQTPMSTGCGHFFCRFCITELLNSKYRAPCPLCKKSFTRRSVQEVIQRQSIVIAARKLAVTCENIIGIKFFSKTREDLVSSKDKEKAAKENRKLSKKRKSEEILTDGDDSKTDEHITQIANDKDVSNSASSEEEVLPTYKRLVPQDLDTFRTLPCTVPIQKMIELEQSNPALFFDPPKRSQLRTYSRKALKHDNKTHVASVLFDSSKEMSCEIPNSHLGKKIKDDESTEIQNLKLISENPIVVNNMKIRRKSRLNLKASEQKKNIMNKNRLNALKNKTNEVDKDKYIMNDDSFLSKASKKNNDLKGNNIVDDDLTKENDGKFISSPKRGKNVKNLEKNNDTPCIKKSRGRPTKRSKRLVKVTTPISNSSADDETVYLRMTDAENCHLPVINDSVGHETPKRKSSEKECFNLNEIDISPKTSNHALKTIVAAESSELLESEMCPDTAVSVYSVASPEANKTVLSHKSPGWSRVKATGKDFRMKKFSRLNVEKNLPHVLLKDINADDSMHDTVTTSKTDVDCHSNEIENAATKSNFDVNEPSAAKDNCYKNLACQSSQAEDEHAECINNTEINLISDCHPERESGKELMKEASTVFGQSNQQCSESARSSNEENVFAAKESGLTNEGIRDVPNGEASSENTGEFVITCNQNNEIESQNLNKKSDTNSLIIVSERGKSSNSLSVSLEHSSHTKGDKRKDTEISYEAVSAFTGDLNHCPIGLSGNDNNAISVMNSIAEDQDKNSMQAEESLMDTDIVNANDSEIFEPDPLHLKNFISKKYNDELKNLYKSAAVNNVEVLHEVNKKSDKSTSFQPSDVQNKNKMNTSNEVDSHFSKLSKLSNSESIVESALHDDEEVDDIRYIEHSQQTSQRFYNFCDNTGIRQNNLLSVVQKESVLLSVRDAAFQHEASVINLKERDQKRSCQNFSFTYVPKTKVVKRTCLTLEEIQDAFVKSNMSGQAEPICCLPFLGRDFKLDICVSEETLNISVLKVIESSEVFAQDNASFSEKNIQTSNCNMPLNSPLAIELSSNVESDASILEECNPPKKCKIMLDSLPCLNNYTIDPQNSLKKHNSLLHHEKNAPEPSADGISPQHKRLHPGFSENVTFDDLSKEGIPPNESLLNQPEKITSEFPVCGTLQKQTDIEHSEISEKEVILPELQQCSVEIPNSEQEHISLNKLQGDNPGHLIRTSSSHQKDLSHFESSNDVDLGNIPKNEQSHMESHSSKQIDHSLNQLPEDISKRSIHVIPPQHEKQDLQMACNVRLDVIPKTNQSSDSSGDTHDIHCLLVKEAEISPRISKSTEKSQPVVENFGKSPDTDVLRHKTVEISRKESTSACSNITSKSKSFSLDKEDSDLSFSQSSTEECDPFQLNASFYRIRSVPASSYKQIDEDLSSDPDMAFANEMVAPLRNLAEKMDPSCNKISKGEHEKREKVDEFTSLNDSDERDCSGNLDLLEKLVSSGNKKTSQKSSRLSLRLRNKSSKFKRIKSNDSTDDSDEELLLENKKSSKKMCSEPSDKRSNTVLQKLSDKSSPSPVLNSAVSMQSSDGTQTHDTMKDNSNSTLSEEIPDGNASEIIMEIEDLDKKIKSLEEKLKQCGQGELLAARSEQTILKGKGCKEHSKTSDNIIHLDDSDDSTDLFPQSVPPTPPQLLAHDKDPKSSYKSFYNHT